MKVLSYLALVTVGILIVSYFFKVDIEPKREILPKVIIVTSPNPHR